MAFNPRDVYYIFDSPVPFSSSLSTDRMNPDLMLYPVMMRDYIVFHAMADCLIIEKNSVPDPKVISMSYLEYMYSIANDDNKYILLFDGLLRLVLKKPDMKANYKMAGDKAVFIIDDVVFTAEDFDALRIIIAEQNMFELPDETIQKSVRDKMAQAQRDRDKIKRNKVASLEEQIISVAIYTGWEIERIYNLSIRKFIKTLKRADHILHSQIYLAASMSGLVEFKNKDVVKHWLAEIEEDKHKGSMVALDSIQKKVDFSDAKS